MKKLACGLFFVVLLSTIVTGDTKFTTTFKDASVTKPNFTKVVVAYATSDTDLRNRVEDGLVRRTQRCIAAHRVIPDGMTDREALREHLAKSGIDGALVVRLVDYQNEKVVISGESMDVMIPSFYDYWGMYGNVMTISRAGLIRDEKLFVADLILYSVATGKPIWVGQLKESNPKSLRELLDNLVKAGSAELKKQKML
jgi:hypothetical protein